MSSRSSRVIAAAALAISIAALSGCASVQMADVEQDKQSKKFAVQPGKSNVYIYRDEFFWGGRYTLGVVTDGVSVGETVGNSYIVLELPPGRHTLVSKGENDFTFHLVTEEGKNYFVWQEVKMGGFYPRSQLHLVNEIKGRAGVEECSLIAHIQPVYADLPSQTSPAMSSATENPSSRTRMDVDILPPGPGKIKRNAYAVVIGIEQYREKLPKADFADRDATLMGEYLTKVLGYPEEQVAVLLNERASKADLGKYIEHWLPGRVEAGSTVFVYFSGHGAPNAKTSEAYMVPYDGDPAFVEATGYPLKRLYEYLGKLPAKEVVVVLDSCFSGAGSRSVIAEGMRPMALSIENPILAGARTVVLAASAGSQASSTYKEKGHGLLTYFFLKGLQGEADTNKDGAVALAELFDYLKPQVERVARREFNNEQTPQLLGSAEMLKRGVRLVEPRTP